MKPPRTIEPSLATMEAASPDDDQREVERPVLMRRVHRPSLAEVAVEEIRKMIVHGRVLPGEPLDEPTLCDALGVSRTPVREALKLLAAEGLIELRRNRNPIVAAIDARQLAHLFEVESLIESRAARLAATRMDAKDLKRLDVLQERMERYRSRRDLRGYFEINQEIHKLVVAGAKNPVLVETHSWLLGRLQRARYLALGAVGRWEESVMEHREILKALKAGDAELSATLFARHVERTGTIVAATASDPNQWQDLLRRSAPRHEAGK